MAWGKRGEFHGKCNRPSPSCRSTRRQPAKKRAMQLQVSPVELYGNLPRRATQFEMNAERRPTNSEKHSRAGRTQTHKMSVMGCAARGALLAVELYSVIGPSPGAPAPPRGTKRPPTRALRYQHISALRESNHVRCTTAWSSSVKQSTNLPDMFPSRNRSDRRRRLSKFERLGKPDE